MLGGGRTSELVMGGKENALLRRAFVNQAMVVIYVLDRMDQPLRL